ncbi:MAG: FAD-dependent monooxygenase [Alphaproteobacteria bacterium]|jgi:2-octaprenyl-6-methoxyphenol hydroxylase|tara:strand:+ start:11125 stop:12303 length:1179 start_codon:yes stop_codon:yes gene_type:complete
MLKEDSNIAIVGCGIIGLTCALLLSKLNIGQITIFGHYPDYNKNKTTALLESSYNLYKNLNIFNEKNTNLYELKELKIHDRILDNKKCLNFKATEINRECFAYNIEDNLLSKMLRKKIVNDKNIIHIDLGVEKIEYSDGENILITSDKVKYNCKLIVAADGKNSLCRNSAKIKTKIINYNQSAVISRISHSNKHHDTSNEIHRIGGPLTSVPLKGNTSAIVWLDNPMRMSEIITTDGFEDFLRNQFENIFDGITILDKPFAIPMQSIQSQDLSKLRTVLVGDSAHIMPPIGAQGLNLGLRDVAWLYEIINNSNTKDFGSRKVLSDYKDKRWLDIYKRQKAVELLNNSLISDNKSIKIARKIGLYSLSNFNFIRKFLLTEGMVNNAYLPSVML